MLTKLFLGPVCGVFADSLGQSIGKFHPKVLVDALYAGHGIAENLAIVYIKNRVRRNGAQGFAAREETFDLGHVLGGHSGDIEALRDERV